MKYIKASAATIGTITLLAVLGSTHDLVAVLIGICSVALIRWGAKVEVETWKQN